MKSLIPTEAQEAQLFMDLCAYHPNTFYGHILTKYLIHIPNGGSRHHLEANNLKKQGVKPGVSDYFLAYPTEKYYGLWIELKRSEARLSKLSPEQHDWLHLMSSVGYRAEVAWGAQAALHCVNRYLGGIK